MKFSGYIIWNSSSFCILPTSTNIVIIFPFPLHCFNLYLQIRCVVGKELCPGRSASGPVERLPAAREASHAESTITSCDTATTDTAAATNTSSTAASATAAANGKLHHIGTQFHDFET